MKIYLVGITGSGKSTFGKILAERLTYKFIDLDRFIEEKEGLSVSDIFKKKTEPYFRKVESECLKETFHFENIVVATGGGAPCFHEGISKINQHGISIWLNPPLETIAMRLNQNPNVSQRPMFENTELEGILSFLEIKLSERKAFYAQAHYELNSAFPEKDDLERLISVVKS
ncbi:MAG: shikimate kinase [Cytophagales bacterium]